MNDKRLIDAADARRNMIALATGFHSELVPIDAVLITLENAPTVDAAPVVHGRWEPHPNYPGFDRCSECKNCIIGDDWANGEKWNYCPNCGAKMDGERINDDEA